MTGEAVLKPIILKVKNTKLQLNAEAIIGDFLPLDFEGKDFYSEVWSLKLRVRGVA